jgi:hypothetical protein
MDCKDVEGGGHNLIWGSFPSNCLEGLQKTTKTCLTNFTQLSPAWEAANCTDTQELPNILRNPKVHYCVHNSPPLVPILSQIDPVHATSSYLSKIHFNIIHPLFS